MKMGEANEMLQALGDNITFRAYKSAVGRYNFSNRLIY